MAATITQPISARRVLKLSPSKLHPSRYQTRDPACELEDDIWGLAESIKEVGLLELPGVRPHPDKDGEYEIIKGHRRVQAIMEHLHWNEIPCLLYEGLTEAEVLKLVVIDNVQRCSLTPFEEGRAYLKAAKMFKWDRPAIAKFFHRPDWVVKEDMELAESVSEWRKFMNIPEGDALIRNGSVKIRNLLHKLSGKELIQGLKMVAGESPDYKPCTLSDLSNYVLACLNAKGKRSYADVMHALDQQEKENASLPDKIRKNINKIISKADNETRKDLELVAKDIEALVSNTERKTEIVDRLENAKPKEAKCPKCKLSFDVAGKENGSKFAVMLQPREKKFKNKIVTVALPLEFYSDEATGSAKQRDASKETPSLLDRSFD